MKKTLFGICTLLFAVSIMATNNLSIEADASVHNGLAAGDPAGFIDINGKLDTSGMAAGSLICFNVLFENFDFTFAGYEFMIEYPSWLTSMSTTDADWEAETGATYKKGGFITSTAVQFLPASSDGSRTAATVSNPQGKVRIGMLWTDPNDRPAAGAGGVIGQVCFTLNPNLQLSCDSAEETVRIYLTSNTNAEADIFANDSATRVVLGNPATISVKFGNPSKFIRGDFNKNLTRNAIDALGAALCCLNGQSNCTGWTANTADEFTQTFNYNCDGAANAIDALGMAKLCLGLQNRSASKQLETYDVTGKGAFVIDSEGTRGAQAFVAFKMQNIVVESISIDKEAEKAGWVLIDKSEDDHFMYTVLNFQGDAVIPRVTMKYTTNGEGQIAIAETAHQTYQFEEFKYTPLVEDHGAFDGSKNIKLDQK